MRGRQPTGGRRRRPLAACGAVLTVVLVACSPASEPPAVPAIPPVADGSTPGTGGTFRVAITEPAAIVPGEAADRDGLLVVDALFDSLTAVGEADRVVAAAATRWSPDEALATWTFTLRDDARFSDGTPVTADDFAFAWDRAATGPTGYHLRHVRGYDAVVAGTSEHLAGVEVLDPTTLRVHLVAPFADFPAVVAHPALGPLPRTRWEADPAAERRRPVGNGPFAMAEDWAKGRFIRADRAEGWANGLRAAVEPAAAVDEVVFRVLDPDSAYLAFQQGRVDLTAVPSGALEEAIDAYGLARASDDGVGVVLADEPTIYELGFAAGAPPFDEPEVRRAVSLAIDRVSLAEATLDGSARPARSLVPPALEGSRWRACTACTYDPEEARALFAAHDVRELTLTYSAGGGHREVAERLRADLATAGVRLQLEQLGYDDFVAAVRAGRASLFRWGWTADHPTLDDVLFPLVHSGSADNVLGYADPEVDALLETARGTADPQARRAAYQAAEDLVLGRDQAVVPLFTYRHRLVVSTRVRGLELDPFGRPDWSAVSLREAGAAPTGAG